MDLIPYRYKKPSKSLPLQSYLFGHRVQPSQTKYEYLIEFLQVVIAKKFNAYEKSFDNEFFPVDRSAVEETVSYQPETRIGLKRFVFFPKSKLEGKAEVDKVAYEKCVDELIRNINSKSDIKRRNCVKIIQNLLRGFSAVNQSRSWFDQNMLPICPEVILPEGMGVKKWRQGLIFSTENADIDGKFDYHRYTYMCRGGEVYYLHLLAAINRYPNYQNVISARLKEMINSFPQFSYLCNFVQNTWDNYMQVIEGVKKETKDLGIIPAAFQVRDEYLLKELTNFLNSKAHPFEKMEMLANGIILQLLRAMYLAASTPEESNCWVVDVNCRGYESPEMKKIAISSFKHNEEVINNYLYRELDELRSVLKETDEAKIIKGAADDSYRLFRKMGKMIGIVIPATGPGMRFSLSEEIIKFLVLSIIPPKGMITLDEFMDQLYDHYGMVIGPQQYRREMEAGSVKEVGELSFMEENKQAFSQKLKDCGFLRDLSDATSIVENPYESEVESK